MNKTQIFAMICGVLALVWIWPNFVHEPLHLVALQTQGATGNIAFDWGFPPYPSITRGPIQSVAGGLWFLLLPSIMSVVLLIWLALSKVNLWKASLGIYLAFDLLENGMGWERGISDFHWLVAVPGGKVWAFGLVVVAFATGSYILVRLLNLHKARVQHVDIPHHALGGSARGIGTDAPQGCEPVVRSHD